jgi:ubiquitin carboxyl-terminal hydrolase 4/11/15
LDDSWKSALNVVNPRGSHGAVVRAFASLVHDVWSGAKDSLSPGDLKFAMGQFASQFDGWAQQDSHELIIFMLDAIHEDLNRATGDGHVVNPIGDGSNDDAVAAIAWESYLKHHSSIVVDTFHGQLRSRLTCPSCGRIVVGFDAFAALSVPIADGEVTLWFTPTDFASDRLPLTVSVEAGAGQTDFVVAVSDQLETPVSLVIGSLSGSCFEWNIPNGDAIFAFEIAGTDNFYVPCEVRLPPTDGQDIFIGPFLLEFANPEEATPDRIKDQASRQLASVWSGPDANNEIPPIVNQIAVEKLEPGDGRFEVLDFEQITADSQLSYVSSQIVRLRLTLNGFEEEGFSLTKLVFRGQSSSLPPLTKPASHVTLSDCLEQFAAPLTLDPSNRWLCPNCNQSVCATKKMDIWRLPTCLIVQLKRFTNYEKISRLVEFADVLDMTPFVIGPNEHCHYRLYAVSEHYGGLCGGHYTAHAKVVEKDKEDGQWYYFNDSSARKATESAAHSESAYLLFYERIG